MPEVIFDASFLMALAESPTTWYEDLTQALGKFDPLILDCVEAELEKIGSEDGRKARVARVALEMAKSFSRAACGGSDPDSELVSAALGRKASVATTDKALARTLSKLRVKVVGLRSGRVFV